MTAYRIYFKDSKQIDIEADNVRKVGDREILFTDEKANLIASVNPNEVVAYVLIKAIINNSTR